MVKIGVFEIIGTGVLILVAVSVVVLFILIGWFIVWKLILSHFRFFREILGMDSSDEERDSPEKYKGVAPSGSTRSTMTSDKVPAHVLRRKQHVRNSTSNSSLVSAPDVARKDSKARERT